MEVMKRELGYYWVKAFDCWIIAEFIEGDDWFMCGNEEDINDVIEEVGIYIGADKRIEKNKIT